MNISRKIALTGVLASTFFILRFIPIGFPVIGLPGATIRLSQIWVLTTSALFPPEISVLAVALGAGLGSAFSMAPPFYALGFLPATVAAATTSLYKYSWWKPLTIYLPILAGYLIYPDVGIIWTYPLHAWFHLAVLSLYTLGAISWRRYGRELSILLGAASGQATGTLLFMAMYYPNIIDYDAFIGIWIATSIVYPIERMILAGGGVILYHALYKALERYLGRGYLETI